MAATFVLSAATVFLRPLLRLVVFLLRIWDLLACARITLPFLESLKRFFAPLCVLILGIPSSSLVLDYLFDFGARNIIMLRPSSFAGFSTLANSWQASANRVMISVPSSGCPSSLPRKRIVTLTLSPPLMNFCVWFSLVLKSCVSILRESRTSLISTICWFFLASFSRLACSKRYLP